MKIFNKIIRMPRTSNQKREGMAYIKTSLDTITLLLGVMDDGNYLEAVLKCPIPLELAEAGAKKLGFSNIEECYEYKKTHKL